MQRSFLQHSSVSRGGAALLEGRGGASLLTGTERGWRSPLPGRPRTNCGPAWTASAPAGRRRAEDRQKVKVSEGQRDALSQLKKQNPGGLRPQEEDSASTGTLAMTMVMMMTELCSSLAFFLLVPVPETWIHLWFSLPNPKPEPNLTQNLTLI